MRRRFVLEHDGTTNLNMDYLAVHSSTLQTNVLIYFFAIPMLFVTKTKMTNNMKLPQQYNFWLSKYYCICYCRLPIQIKHIRQIAVVGGHIFSSPPIFTLYISCNTTIFQRIIQVISWQRLKYSLKQWFLIWTWKTTIQNCT